MNVLGSLGLGVLLTALVVTGAMALAQEQGQRMHGTMGQQTDQPMMERCPMMGSKMGQRGGMMGQGMGPGSMHGGMGPGMMQGGMGEMFGSRVTPMMKRGL